MEQEEIRKSAQEEIESIAQESASISRIEHHTATECGKKFGLTWKNLSHIYFTENETIGVVHNLRDELESNEYLATVSEENNETCLIVESTAETFERFD